MPSFVELWGQICFKLFFMIASGSTKAAVDMLTKSLALELGPHQVSNVLSYYSKQLFLHL